MSAKLKMLAAPEWLVAFGAWLGVAIAAVFGRPIALVLAFVIGAMVLEFWVLLVRRWLAQGNILAEEKVAGFWLKRSLLLVLPFIGTMVDYTWYWFSPPGSFFGGEAMHRWVTQMIALALLGWQLASLVQAIQSVWRIPWLEGLVRLLVKMQFRGEPPRDLRRWVDEEVDEHRSERQQKEREQ